jgi:DNA polymerase III alpha subunit
MWTETNTEQQLIEGVLRHGPEILERCQSAGDVQRYLDRISAEHLDYPTPLNNIDSNNWFIPKDYYPNLVEFIYASCTTQEQTDRVSQELELFISKGMFDVLYVMKYIVDTLREHNVVWGVGRGSSVASYVLHIIGVHKIDSVKYNIPIEEFFKGD